MPEDPAAAAAERRRGALAVRAAAAAQVFVADPAHPVVEAADVHHLVRVLRLRRGDAVVAADGAGRWSLCRVSGAGDPSPDDVVEVDGPVETDEAPEPPLTVGFAPAKGERPEWVVQKLTELGVDRMVPLLTERSVVRWEGVRGSRVLERLARVAREAAAQCRRTRLPELGPMTTLAAFAAAGGAGRSTVALAQLGGPPPTRLVTSVAVGPEGGWAPSELALGLDTVGLANQVLRAETAAVVAGALLGALRDGTLAEGPPAQRAGRDGPGAGGPGVSPAGGPGAGRARRSGRV